VARQPAGKKRIGQWLVDRVIQAHPMPRAAAVALLADILDAVRHDIRRGADALAIDESLGVAARVLAARIEYAIRALS